MAAKSTSTDWNGDFLKSKFCKGEGMVVEGEVVDLRVHSMFLRKMDMSADQADRLPQRYTVVVLEKPRVHGRVTVQRRGRDEELDYHANMLLPAGHKNKVTVPELDANQLLQRLGGCALPDASMLPARMAELHPKKAGRFEFWIDVEKPGAKNLATGTALRLVTLGDSILVERFEQLNGGVNLFKGAEKGHELSSGWIGNVQQFSEPHHGHAGDDREGVDEDEWDD